MCPLKLTEADLQRALPDMSSTYRLPGLDGSIEIVRDGYGIPHVRATTMHDVFFGQGFATTQDRLWHMDYDRRRAYGRWAEFAGKAAVEGDLLMRKMQIGASVCRDYQALNQEAKMMLDAYSSGVNAFIKSTKTLPVEYALVDGKPELWRPWDCLAVYKMRHIMMGGYEAKLWRARILNALGPERAASLFESYLPGHMVIVPPGEIYDGQLANGLATFQRLAQDVDWLSETDSGSNSWALSGSRTISGKPLVAGDPHRGLDTPNVYYQIHLKCPEFDAIGLAFPGFPGMPHFGHNSKVAWCVTHAMSDYQDLYMERFKDEGGKYEFRGQWRRAKITPEIVKVRGAVALDMNSTETLHGPVIIGDPKEGKAISLKYTALDGPNRFSECIVPMLRTENADEMKESMREWIDPCNNFVFADVGGSISYLNRGRVPIRSEANHWLPVPGWTGEHEWQGFIPFEEVPYIQNPKDGILVTANNKIAGKEYQYHLSLDYAPEYRYRRIYDRLELINNSRVEDMQDIHAERMSIPAATLIPLLLKVVPLDKQSKRAMEHLKSWDFSMESDAVAPTVYSAFRLKLTEKLIRHLVGSPAEDLLGAEAFLSGNMHQLEAAFVAKANGDDTSLLPQGKSWMELMAEALKEGVGMLTSRFGEEMESWTWGRVHYTRPRHTLSEAFPEISALIDPQPVAVGGDGDTPQAASFSREDLFVLTSTSVARYVFDTNDWEKSVWIVPLGASGHPGSPHYSDQTQFWQNVDCIPMTYDWNKIRKQAVSTQRLDQG